MLGLQTDASGTESVMRRYSSRGKGTLNLTEFAKLVDDLRKFSGGGEQVLKEAGATPGLARRDPPPLPGSAGRTGDKSRMDAKVRAALGCPPSIFPLHLSRRSRGGHVAGARGLRGV